MEIEVGEVQIRASRLIWICRTYPRVLICALIVKIWAHGSISFPLFGFYVVVALLMGLAFSVLPIRYLDIILNKDGLTAPARRRVGFKSITVKLSDIVISDSFVDKLRGTTITTIQGDIINLSSLHYSRKSIKKVRELIRERVWNAEVNTIPSNS